MKRKYTRHKPVIRKTASTRRTATARNRQNTQFKLGPVQYTYTDEPIDFKRYTFDRLYWLAILFAIIIVIVILKYPALTLKSAGVTGAGVGLGAGLKKLFGRHPT